MIFDRINRSFILAVRWGGVVLHPQSHHNAVPCCNYEAHATFVWTRTTAYVQYCARHVHTVARSETAFSIRAVARRRWSQTAMARAPTHNDVIRSTDTLLLLRFFFPGETSFCGRFEYSRVSIVRAARLDREKIPAAREIRTRLQMPNIWKHTSAAYT
jgi:hypothetical protein